MRHVEVGCTVPRVSGALWGVLPRFSGRSGSLAVLGGLSMLPCRPWARCSSFYDPCGLSLCQACRRRAHRGECTPVVPQLPGSCCGVSLSPSCLQAAEAIVPASQWLALRGYASLHLLALYGAVLGGLPGLAGLQPEGARPTLSMLGLWDPSITGDLAPVLSVLLLVG
jgi:hypothetical protein